MIYCLIDFSFFLNSLFNNISFQRTTMTKWQIFWQNKLHLFQYTIKLISLLVSFFFLEFLMIYCKLPSCNLHVNKFVITNLNVTSRWILFNQAIWMQISAHFYHSIKIFLKILQLIINFFQISFLIQNFLHLNFVILLMIF